MSISRGRLGPPGTTLPQPGAEVRPKPGQVVRARRARRAGRVRIAFHVWNDWNDWNDEDDVARALTALPLNPVSRSPPCVGFMWSAGLARFAGFVPFAGFVTYLQRCVSHPLRPGASLPHPLA